MIELLEPGRLWWGLGAVLLWLLAVPPRPSRQLDTAHLPQWRAAMARCRRLPIRFPWLRTCLLVLAFSASVVAFCRPQRPARPGPTRLCILVDASASLGARSGEGRAFDQLRAALVAGLDGLPLAVRAETRLWRCDARLTMVAGVGDLGEPSTCGLGMDLGRAAIGAGGVDTAVWTLTDGRSGVPENGAVTIVGRPGDNLAVTGLRVDDRWPLPDVEFEVEVANFTPRACTATLEASSGPDAFADVLLPQRCELAPGARELVHVHARRGRGGPFRFTVRAATRQADALPLDDGAGGELPPPPAPRIAVLSDSDAPVLRRAAEALAAETGGEVVDARADTRAGYLLVEGGMQRAEAWRDLRGVTFGTELAGGEAAAAPPLRTDAAIEWRRDDPLTSGLDFSELRVGGPLVAIGGEPLVWRGGQPLLSVHRGRRVVQCAFRLPDANLWLLAAFPQLLRRAYAAAHADVAAVRMAPDNLLDAAESDLRASSGAAANRPLPAFGAPPVDLTAWFALAALLCLVARTALTAAP